MIKLITHAFLIIFFINIINAQNGNVGIGTSTPDASAILDITSTTKGMLIPRVNLSTPPATPATGLTVFNTNAAFSSGPSGSYGTGIGYYFNSSSDPANPKWEKLPSTLDVAALVASGGGGVPTGRTITMSGSANQITVTGSDVPYDLSADRSWTFSLPQNIHTGASPTFAGATFTGLSTAGIVTNTSAGVLGTTSLVPIANGGTNSNATATNGGVGYGTGTAHAYTAAGTSGQILRSNGAAAPTWANPSTILSVNNGLTGTAPNLIQLGGALVVGTTFTMGSFPVTYNNSGVNNFTVNLSSTGDFVVQDNGTSVLFVRDNGTVGIGGVTASLTPLHVEKGLSGSVNTTANYLSYFNNTTAGGGALLTNVASNASTSRYLQCQVAGTEVGCLYGNGTNTLQLYSASDARLKKNIRNTSLGLSTLLKMKVRDYEWKLDSKTVNAGFIAQELYNVYPEAVTKGSEGELNGEGGTWMVNYAGITPLLVKGIQDLYDKIVVLEKENASLKAENIAIKNNKADINDIEQLKAEIDGLKKLIVNTGLKAEK